MATRKIRNAWWVDFRWAGARHRKRSPVNTRAGAAQYELILREKLMRGELLDHIPTPASAAPAPAPGPNVLFREFAEQWFTTYVMVNSQPSEQRQRCSVLRARLVPWFGHIYLGDISTRAIEEFKLHELGHKLSRKTVNNHLAILSRCLRCALQWGYINTMPMIQLLRVCLPPFRVLTEEEVAVVISDNTDPKWNMMIRVALRTGLRRGELMALDWTDIDIQRKRLTVNHAVSAGCQSPASWGQVS
jgi:integrase